MLVIKEKDDQTLLKTKSNYMLLRRGILSTKGRENLNITMWKTKLKDG